MPSLYFAPCQATLATPATLDYETLREAGIKRMADAVEQYLDWRKLDRIFA